MKQGQRVVTDKGQKGTIRYRFKGGKKWYCCITPDNWNGKGKTLIDCPEKQCQLSTRPDNEKEGKDEDKENQTSGQHNK